MNKTRLIDTGNVKINSIVVDRPGGFMIATVGGEPTLIPLDNKQINPILDAAP